MSEGKLNEKIKKANKNIKVELDECGEIPFEDISKDVSGFDISAIELPDGRYCLWDTGRIIDEVPRYIRIKNGNTYEFENIDYGRELDISEFPYNCKHLKVKKGKFCSLVYV